MTETLINPNQIAGATKILNVVENGSLTRNGAVYSGFSSSNYLQLGNIVDNGYISLSNNVKDFGAMTESADSWEMVFKFKHISSEVGVLFACDVSEGSQIVISSSVELDLSNSSGNWSIGSATGTTTLEIGTTYWLKIEFTGDAYVLSLSTDGINYTIEITISSSTKLTNRGDYVIGKNNGGYPLKDDLFIEGCSIKADSEYWWKGVENL